MPSGAIDGQGEATDLADRLGDPPLEEVGPVLDEPVGTPGAAGLFVGEEGEHDLARRDGAVAFELAGQRERHPGHVLHVDRHRVPQMYPSLTAPENGWTLQSAGSAGTTSRWAWISSAPAVGVRRSGEACEDVPAARAARLDVLCGVSHFLELLRHPFGALFLAFCGFRLPPGVGGVEPDQPADEIDYFSGRRL